MQIYHPDGSLLGEMELSEQQQRQLEAGSAIDLQFHTPRMLVGTLGKDGGRFSLRLDEGRAFTSDPNVFKRYLRQQAAVADMQKLARGK